jgi:hypothetical protein
MTDDNDLHSNPPSTLSPDLESPPFKLIREKIANENIQQEFPTDTLSFEPSSHTKLRQEIKHVLDRILF